MRHSLIDILEVTLIEGLMEILEESEKGMDGSRWQGMTPPISMTFKGEEEEDENKLIIINFMGFTKMKKIINVLGYRYFVLTVKL